MTLLEKLDDIGLKGKRARVYLACLELGRATAGDIAQKAQIQRTTAYDILQDLIRDGLINVTPKKRGATFCAEPPESLKELILQKQRRVDDIMPELHSLFNRELSKPRIRYYEGVQGVRAMFLETLCAHDTTLRALLSVSDFNDFLGKDWFIDYTNKRIASGKKLLVIRPEGKEVEGLYPSSTKDNREVRFTPRELVFGLSQYLFDNKVALISTKKEGYGLIVESHDFSVMQMGFFDMLWSVSKIIKRTD